MLRICPMCNTSYHAGERYCVADATELVATNNEEVDAARIGTTLGNYKLLSVIGRGGMGTIYAAEHIYIGKRVAMKILHERQAKNAEALEGFLLEARAATSINHPNIIEIFDFGPTPDRGVYLAMEILEGKNLDAVLDADAPLPLHRAISIVHQIASALAAAHEKGIVHADLKPANIMLIQRPGRREVIRATGIGPDGQPTYVIEKEGDFDFVKVLDFGIAKIQNPNNPNDTKDTKDTKDLKDASAAMRLAHVIGTPEYMSPEAAQGLPLDGRSDVYSLGVLFYEMLTAQVPFRALTPREILKQHISEEPPPPSRTAPNAEITPAAERLILRALSKDPDERPRDMDQFRADLAGCYGSVAYRRNANRLPGALARGMMPRPRRLSDELDEWLQREKQISRAATTLQMEPVIKTAIPTSEAAAVDPVLLTDRKPI